MIRRPPRSTRTDTLFPYTTLFRSSAVDISEEVGRLQQKNQALTKSIYAKLTPWQTALVARHPQRHYTLDYVSEIFTDFLELHGDRMYADDLSIIGGLPRFNGTPCMLVGTQKVRDRSEERRVGKACVGACSIRGAPLHKK